MTQNIAISAPSHNFVGLYLRQKSIYQQSGKKLVKQCLWLPFGEINKLACRVHIKGKVCA